jgi:hypothetical protein
LGGGGIIIFFFCFLLSFDLQIGVIIEDKEFINSQMDGKPWEAGKFTVSLRLSLWSEHLGLHAEEVIVIPFYFSSLVYIGLQSNLYL